MPYRISSLADLARHGFSEVLDVRSPAEHAEDHVPGAINLPALDNEERARIGTIYMQESRFLARKVGAALVARNAARHLEGHLGDKPKDYRPLVYCWRGGQRSGSFASILMQIGWRAEVVEGGYRSFRRAVHTALYETPVPAPVVVLDGNTGTAKTELLHLLPARGVQVIDLEGLARHRGSLFGGLGPQPSQRSFESALAMKLAALDPARPVVVEAESSRIGAVNLPPQLWAAMRGAPRLRIEAPLAARARYLARAYDDMTAAPETMVAVIDRLRPLHPRDRIELWQQQARNGDHVALAEGLMTAHYDPRYGRQRARHDLAEVVLQAQELSPDALPGLADRVAEAVIRTAGSAAAPR